MREPIIFGLFNFCRLFDVPLHDARLAHKGVLERGEENAEAGVLDVKDVIHIIRRLLCFLDLHRDAGLEFGDLIRSAKDAQERWQDCLHHVAHLGHDNFGAALFLVSKGVSTVIGRGRFAVRRYLLVNVSDCVVCCGLDDGLKGLIAHWLAGLNGRNNDFSTHLTPRKYSSGADCIR